MTVPVTVNVTATKASKANSEEAAQEARHRSESTVELMAGCGVDSGVGLNENGEFVMEMVDLGETQEEEVGRCAVDMDSSAVSLSGVAHAGSKEAASWLSVILSPSVLAWTSMVLAVLSGATVGPVFKFMGNYHVQPCMSATWRGTAMIIFLVPLAAIEHFYKSKTIKTPLLERWMTVHPESKYPVLAYVMVCGLGWSGSLLLWIIGLRYTTTVKASILASVHPLMLVIYLVCTGKHVSKMEWMGVAVVIYGFMI
jgi:hypothetical protein